MNNKTRQIINVLLQSRKLNRPTIERLMLTSKEVAKQARLRYLKNFAKNTFGYATNQNTNRIIARIKSSQNVRKTIKEMDNRMRNNLSGSLREALHRMQELLNRLETHIIPRTQAATGRVIDPRMYKRDLIEAFVYRYGNLTPNNIRAIYPGVNNRQLNMINMLRRRYRNVNFRRSRRLQGIPGSSISMG